jgi:hypothetical protein
MAKDMANQYETEQTPLVEQTDAARRAYGEKVSAHNVEVKQRESDFKSVGGHMFADTKNADRSKDRVRPVKAK